MLSRNFHATDSAMLNIPVSSVYEIVCVDCWS